MWNAPKMEDYSAIKMNEGGTDTGYHMEVP